jgi:hypothetical protein
MKLSQIKALLPTLDKVRFKLENGQEVPTHYHVTEVGTTHKHFIDCGGTVRNETKVSFQLWYANDTDHTLSAQKLANIILLSEQKLQLPDAEVEVEYQTETIGKYNLVFDGAYFILQNTTTACLAEDQCGIPAQKQRIKLSELNVVQGETCTPNGGCC